MQNNEVSVGIEPTKSLDSYSSAFPLSYETVYLLTMKKVKVVIVSLFIIDTLVSTWMIAVNRPLPAIHLQLTFITVLLLTITFIKLGER